MYFKTVNARVTGKNQEPKFLGGTKYIVAYRSVEDNIAGQRNVSFEEFCRIQEGDVLRVEIASHDQVKCFNTDSLIDVALEGMLGPFIHPDLRD